MIVHPNQSQFVGRIQSIVPCQDGWGADLQVEILKNESYDSRSDFISAETGQLLALFVPPRPKNPNFKAGQTMRLKAKLLAGPLGERVVLESAEPYADAAT